MDETTLEAKQAAARKARARQRLARQVAEAEVVLLDIDTDKGMMAEARVRLARGRDRSTGLSWKAGIGLSSGANVKHDSVQLKVLGCGFTVGRKVGLSLLDNEVTLDFGRLFGQDPYRRRHKVVTTTDAVVEGSEPPSRASSTQGSKRRTKHADRKPFAHLQTDRLSSVVRRPGPDGYFTWK